MGCDHFLISGDGFEEKWYFGNWFVLVWVWYRWCSTVLIDRYLLNLTPTSLLPRMQPEMHIYFLFPLRWMFQFLLFFPWYLLKEMNLLMFISLRIQFNYLEELPFIKPMEFVELFVMCCSVGDLKIAELWWIQHFISGLYCYMGLIDIWGVRFDTWVVLDF